jgi:hypothetical protein
MIKLSWIDDANNEQDFGRKVKTMEVDIDKLTTGFNTDFDSIKRLDSQVGLITTTLHDLEKQIHDLQQQIIVIQSSQINEHKSFLTTILEKFKTPKSKIIETNINVDEKDIPGKG